MREETGVPRRNLELGRDGLKTSPHTMIEEVVNDHYASVNPQGIQKRVFLFPDGDPSGYQPRPMGFNFGEQRI